MTNHIVILVFVMLVAGVFGGLINYYLYSSNDPDKQTLPRCLVVAVGAAFLVPVLLDALNSEIILESQGDPSKLLIFTGFCLIAALASKFFVQTMSDRILSEAQYAKERSENIQHDLRVIQKELLPLIDTETEHDVEPEDLKANLDIEEELDVASTRALKILGSGRFIFRSAQGLCREAGVDETAMSKTLNVLVGKNLAGMVSGKKGVRWHITERGRNVLDSIA
jgi:hypothetical protein